LKVAVGIESENGIESKVAEVFEKSSYFAIAFLKDGNVSVELFPTPVSEHPNPGLIPEWLKALGVSVIVARNIGKRVELIAKELGIKVKVGDFETLGDALSAGFEGEEGED